MLKYEDDDNDNLADKRGQIWGVLFCTSLPSNVLNDNSWGNSPAYTNCYTVYFTPCFESFECLNVMHVLNVLNVLNLLNLFNI